MTSPCGTRRAWGPAVCMPVASAAGSGASPALRRRSFSADRAIQSRNRYRTARKPNFSATATGSSIVGVLLQLEGRAGRAQLDLVAGLDRLGAVGVDATAVDL